MFKRLPREVLLGRFDLLVGACLINYVILVLVDSERYLGLFVVLPVLFTIMIAQRATRYSGHWLMVGRVILVAGVILGVIGASTANSQFEAAAIATLAGAILISLVAVYVHVITESDASLQTMYAALACYLLVGILFAYVDGSLALFTGRFFAQSGQHVPSDFPYFSFVTMTTVGYGDLTPAVGYPRSMAVLEAVIGQMVLVTLVARTVASVSNQTVHERRLQRQAAREERTARRRGDAAPPPLAVADAEEPND